MNFRTVYDSYVRACEYHNWHNPHSKIAVVSYSAWLRGEQA